MDVMGTIKKAKADAQLKLLNVTSVANVGISPRSALFLALIQAPGVVKVNSLTTIRLSTITTSINLTIPSQRVPWDQHKASWQTQQ